MVTFKLDLLCGLIMFNKTWKLFQILCKFQADVSTCAFSMHFHRFRCSFDTNILNRPQSAFELWCIKKCRYINFAYFEHFRSFGALI